MPYYPEMTVIQGFTTVIRTRKLPSHAVADAPQVVLNEPVDAVQTVLAGEILGDYHIIDVAAELKIKNPTPQRMDDILRVDEGMRVQFGQELARTGKGRRTRILYAPVEGVVTAILGSRLVLQESRQMVEIKARVPGQVSAADTHQVTISGRGALIQCAWGNGRYAYRAYRFLPPDGFAGLSKMDPRISEYRKVVIISPAPINVGDLMVARQQEVAGVVAPSMSADLREFAMQLTFPVLLTEGFGQRRPTTLAYRLLQENMGRQAAFDAVLPERWADDRPEIMIPLPAEGVAPPAPSADQALLVGTQVRITRAPWDGLVGTVEALPQTPQVLENGLRVPCAQVRLSADRVVPVPLANLELLG